MIQEDENPPKALGYFLEHADYINSSEENEVNAYFTAQQLKEYEKQYADLTDAILTKLINKRYKKEKFYNELWESVINSDVNFDQKNAKIYAIGRIWNDARIPYFCLNNGIKMSDDEFGRIIEENRELLQEATFILGCKYEQRTESSSRLLELLDKCGDERVKTVVMAAIIELIEKRCIFNILRRE